MARKITGKCPLCLESKVLAVSHAIPKAFFVGDEYLSNKRVSKGTLIDCLSIEQSDWCTHLLCEKCEAFMNSNLDDYGIKFLRYQHENESLGLGLRVSEKWDMGRIILFLISIYWRAAHMKATDRRKLSGGHHINQYTNSYFISDEQQVMIRKCINGMQYISETTCAVQLLKIKHDGSYGISESIIENIVLSPIVEYPFATGFPVFSFVFGGFLVVIRTSGVPSTFLGMHGYLENKKASFILPYLDSKDVPTLIPTILSMAKMKSMGLVSDSLRKQDS